MLYSSAFRRLAGITQVVSASEGHVFHNRLTHTLKVAQVARRLAERLRDEVRQHDFDPDIAGPDPDVVETAALAHDIGHPPFGHVVEKELQRLVEPLPLRDSFEGNAQSFRIVTRTALASDRHQGLNLTRASLAALLKYPWLRQPDHPKGSVKWGAYDNDVDDFRFALDLGSNDPLPSAGNPQMLEAAIMDWADDITYAIHDLGDLWRAGLIPADQLAARDDVLADFAHWVERRWAKARRDGLHPPDAPLDAIEAVLDVFPVLFGSYEPYDGGAGQRLAIRTFTSQLIGQCVVGTGVTVVNGVPILDVDPTIQLRVEALKLLTWRYVIERPALAAQQHGQKRVVADVFEVFTRAAAQVPGHDRALLPLRLQDQLDEVGQDSGMDSPAARARLVCDAICSMTEQEILGLHARLTGRDLGSVTRLP